MNVPKLRFGEFEGDWKIKTIGEITSKVGSGSTPSGGAQIYTNSGIPFIRSQNINNDQLIFDDATYIPQLVHEKMQGSAVQANDVLLNITGASIGRSCVVPSNFVEGNVNQHVSIIRFINGYVPHFYQKYLSSSRGQKHISSLQVGSGREGLNFQAIRTIAIPSPEINEQQKIADFLSAVDEKITALTAQKTALTQYKQGMMQRIFAQTLRFKDDNGADYPEWDSMRLEELGEFKSGVGFSESEQGGQEGIPFFKVSDMNLSENTFHMNIANHYVTEEQIQKLKLKVIKKDAIIFAKVGAAIFLERKRIAKNFLIDNNMMAFIPKANLLFMKYLFETVQLSKFAQVGALPSYNSSDLGIIKVGLPNSYEEQTKIARFLTECDDKINAVDAQIQSAQQWKQGLLQQMFV